LSAQIQALETEITIDHAREFQQVDRLGHVLQLVGKSGDSNITVDPRTFFSCKAELD